MNIKLTPVQARVLGCLIEKDLTTPDYYPLSLHALAAACNQKSNRDPVMALSEGEVQAALDDIIKQGLAAQRSDFSARVPKYGHKLSGSLTRAFDFSRPALALLCELLVRGPQTPGELRTRAARMHPFADLNEVMVTLENLRTQEDGSYVAELPRQPGRREARYACLWLEVSDTETTLPATKAAEATSGDYELRLRALEEQVAALTETVQSLLTRLGE